MGSRIEVTEEQINQIRELYSEGYGSNEISKRVGTSRGVVRRIIREKEFKKGASKDKVSVSKEELINLYEVKKLSMSQIAEILGCGKRDISAKLKKYGIPVHHAGCTPIPFTKELLENLYLKQKLTQKQIAEHMHCGISTVGKYLKKYQIKERTNKIPEETLINLYKEGTSIEEISKRVGFKESSIRTRLTELGLITVNSRGNLNNDELLKMTLQGMTIRNMSKKMKCSQRTVIRELQKLGIKPKKYALESVTYDSLYDLIIIQGKELKEVADMYFVSVSTLGDHLRRIGLNVIKEKALVREKALTEDTLRDLYFNKNMKQEEIAKYLNVPRGQVSEKFKEYSIRKSNKWDNITKEKLIELYVNQNMPPCLIAEQLNAPATVIRGKIGRYNLKKLKTPEQIETCKNKAYEVSLCSSRSKGEIEIEELFPTPYHNIHSIINLELDLWYPEQKVAIEYNGDYWHSIEFHRNSGLHLAKQSICKNKGIHLINIFERDWHCARSKKLLNVHLQRALKPETLKKSKGTVKEISNYKENTFSNKHNLNNKPLNYKCIGLYEGKELISTVAYNIENDSCKILRYTAHKDYVEDYTSLIQYLLKKTKLPVIVQYDNRYYNKFPCSLEVVNTKDIEPRLFYVKSRKALREEEATPEYLNHRKCRAIYDCGFTEVKYI